MSRNLFITILIAFVALPVRALDKPKGQPAIANAPAPVGSPAAASVPEPVVTESSSRWLATGYSISAGGEVQFESADNGRSQITHTPYLLRGGSIFKWNEERVIDLELQFSNWQGNDSTGGVSVTRDHYEWLLSARTYLGSLLGSHSKYFRNYIGIGLGFEYELSKTDLLGETDSQTGRPEFLAAALIGVRAMATDHLFFDLEARFAAWSDAAPNPQPAAALLAGWVF
jgi:hypothetical protein